MPTIYAQALEEMLRTNITTKPANVKQLVVDVLNLRTDQLPEDFPTEQQLKSKASSLKTKIRKERGF